MAIAEKNDVMVTSAGRGSVLVGCWFTWLVCKMDCLLGKNAVTVSTGIRVCVGIGTPEGARGVTADVVTPTSVIFAGCRTVHHARSSATAIRTINGQAPRVTQIMWLPRFCSRLRGLSPRRGGPW
eukprot:3329520-Lingulodinium_polyedra.AAC.1